MSTITCQQEVSEEASRRRLTEQRQQHSTKISAVPSDVTAKMPACSIAHEWMLPGHCDASPQPRHTWRLSDQSYSKQKPGGQLGTCVMHPHPFPVLGLLQPWLASATTKSSPLIATAPPKLRCGCSGAPAVSSPAGGLTAASMWHTACGESLRRERVLQSTRRACRPRGSPTITCTVSCCCIAETAEPTNPDVQQRSLRVQQSARVSYTSLPKGTATPGSETML
mmetsp:Transcript_24773/g.58876  ORF Transcript_24773/g.58876 Transcript_24773/m.58876 type:complete len:224 (+) Transcript_24773:124-795(+)